MHDAGAKNPPTRSGVGFAFRKCIIFRYMYTLEWIIPLIPWPLANQQQYKGVDSYFGAILTQKYNFQLALLCVFL